MNVTVIRLKDLLKYLVVTGVTLMVIAWTKLFHAYFQATIGEKYFYKEKMDDIKS